MKIGILTFWWSDDNYGQHMQFFASYKYLESKGYEPYIIRYKPEYSNKLRFLSIFNPVKLLRFISEKTSKRIPVVLRGMKEFRELNLRMTAQVYRNFKDISNNPPDADAYICGSDQVWNFGDRPHDNFRPWFLDFGANEIKRISYAASFGKPFLSERLIKFISPMLKRFDAISVREQEGISICKNAGCQAVHVLDPCFLLDVSEYLKMAEPISSQKPFVIGYFLNVHSQKDIYWKNIMNFIKSRGSIDFKVVPAHGVEAILPGVDFFYPTIPQWLGAYNQAESVLTSSFHGMVFAIIMQKPFMVFVLKGHSAKMNGRITSLLDTLGLIDRIFDPDKGSLASQMDKEINWNEVNQKLVELRSQSMDFLKRALNDEA